MPINKATMAATAPMVIAKSCQRAKVGALSANNQSPAATVTTPLPMSLAVKFLFKRPCMNGPAGGPTSRAAGVTNQPIKIAAPAQKPPATIWMTRSVVIITWFYQNVDPRGVSELVIGRR